MPATTHTTARDAAPRQPQDHLPKAASNGAQSADQELLSFTHDGQTYTLDRPVEDVVTPGWVRRHRHMDPADMTFTVLEEIAGPDALDAIDHMSWKEFRELSDRIGERLEPLFP